MHRRTRVQPSSSSDVADWHGPKERGAVPDTAEAATVEQRLRALWEEPKTLYAAIATVDHKKIGIRYLVTAFAFLVVGGVEAVLIRLQLIGPERALLTPEAYNQIFTLHGITMIFWYAAPILGATTS